MTERDEILAASTSLLKDDPGVADAIVNPPITGSDIERKLRSLIKRIYRWVPPFQTALPEPLGHLQKGLGEALYGKGRRGVSLSSLSERTNPNDPLTAAFFLLCRLLGAIKDLAERDLKREDYDDWSPESRAQFGCQLKQDGYYVWKYVGYRVDPTAIRTAMDELVAVENAADLLDIRREVVLSCRDLVESCLRQIKDQLDEAADDQLLEFRPSSDGAAGYHCKIVQKPSLDRGSA